jgi:hypothetical protein
MKRVVILITITSIAFSEVNAQNEHPRLIDVQRSLDLVEIAFIKQKDRNAYMAFQRARYFVLTNSNVLTTASPGLIVLSSYFENAVKTLSPAVQKIQQSMDVVEGFFVNQEAQVALDSFEKLRFLTFTDDEVLNATDDLRLESRLKFLSSSAEKGELKNLLNDSRLPKDLLGVAETRKPLPPTRNAAYPWPICKWLPPCAD